MKKRILSMVMAIVVLCLSGCGKQEQSPEETDYTSYAGSWIDETLGASMEVIKNSDSELQIDFFMPDATGERIANINEIIPIANIVDNKVSVDFEDSWGVTGTLTFEFKTNDTIQMDITNTAPSGDAWGVCDATYNFVREGVADDTNTGATEEVNAEEPSEDMNVVEELDEKSIEKRRNNKKKAPDEALIAVDLVAQNANCFLLNRCDEYLDITSLGIIKRKTEDGYDIATISAILENERYRVVAEYEIAYQYYDVGGWIMELCNMYKHGTTPLKFEPGDDEIHSECEKLFTSHEIIDHQFTVNEKNEPTHITTFLGVWDAKYASETHKGIRTFTFIDDNWVESWDFEKHSIDFSRLLGTWEFKHYDEYIKINITDVTKENDSYYITYDYQTSPWCDDGRWGGYIASSSFTTDGSSRTEPSKKVNAEFCAEEELDYAKADLHYGGWRDKLKRIDKLGIRYSWGNWVDSSGNNAYNVVHIDVNDGLYINEFHYGYKNEECVTPPKGSGPASWDNWWGGDNMTKTVFFTKERNTAEVEDAMKKLKEMNK